MGRPEQMRDVVHGGGREPGEHLRLDLQEIRPRARCTLIPSLLSNLYSVPSGPVGSRSV